MNIAQFLPKRRHKDSRAARGYHRYRGEKQPVRWFVWLFWAAGFLTLTEVLWQLCRRSEGAGAFLRSVAQSVAALISRVTGILPIPVNEWLIGAVVFYTLYRLISGIIKKNWARLARDGCKLICFASLCVFLFMSLFMVQHSAQPLSESIGLETQLYTKAQLEEYAAFAAEKVNELAILQPRDENGDCDFGSFREISQMVTAEYEALADTYSVFDVPRPGQVKRSLLGGRIMSLFDLAGYYFPWTGESIVSSDVVDSHIPFNIAHERAHALGLGPEAECNFAAWLALKDSEDVRLQYSAWFNAYIYASNALYKQDREASAAVGQLLCQDARHDIRVLNESLERFEGVLNKAGSAINNAYIKSTGQPDGVQSYGKVVDLLLAWHFSKGE